MMWLGPEERRGDRRAEHWHRGVLLRGAFFGRVGTISLAIRDAFDRRGKFNIGHRFDRLGVKYNARCAQIVVSACAACTLESRHICFQDAHLPPTQKERLWRVALSNGSTVKKATASSSLTTGARQGCVCAYLGGRACRPGRIERRPEDQIRRAGGPGQGVRGKSLACFLICPPDERMATELV
jgi:hypothetical protein